MTDNRDNLLQTIPRLFALCATIREAAAHGVHDLQHLVKGDELRDAA